MRQLPTRSIAALNESDLSQKTLITETLYIKPFVLDSESEPVSHVWSDGNAFYLSQTAGFITDTSLNLHDPVELQFAKERWGITDEDVQKAADFTPGVRFILSGNLGNQHLPTKKLELIVWEFQKSFIG